MKKIFGKAKNFSKLVLRKWVSIFFLNSKWMGYANYCQHNTRLPGI